MQTPFDSPEAENKVSSAQRENERSSNHARPSNSQPSTRHTRSASIRLVGVPCSTFHICNESDKIAHEVDRTPTLLSCVGLQLGIALLPESCRKLPHEGTVFRPLSDPVKSRTEIVWKKLTLSRSLQEYVELIRKRPA